MKNLCKLINSPRKWETREITGGYVATKFYYNAHGKTKTIKIIKKATPSNPARNRK